MNKTKRKNNKRKRGRRRTIKYKGGKDNGKETDSVTVYMWPKNDPKKKGTNEIMHEIRNTQYFPDYTSRIAYSIKNGQRLIDSMLTDKSVVPEGVEVQSKSLVVYTPTTVANKTPIVSSKNSF